MLKSGTISGAKNALVRLLARKATRRAWSISHELGAGGQWPVEAASEPAQPNFLGLPTQPEGAGKEKPIRQICKKELTKLGGTYAGLKAVFWNSATEVGRAGDVKAERSHLARRRKRLVCGTLERHGASPDRCDARDRRLAVGERVSWEERIATFEKEDPEIDIRVIGAGGPWDKLPVLEAAGQLPNVSTSTLTFTSRAPSCAGLCWT